MSLPTPVKTYLPTYPILGIFGAKVLHVARCPSCRKTYDGKNGTTLGRKVLLTYLFVIMGILILAWLGLKGII